MKHFCWIVKAITGLAIDLVQPSLRARPGGWPAIRGVLPAVYKHLTYQTDAEALVLVVDSDDSRVHREGASRDETCDANCRLCDLRSTLRQARLATSHSSKRRLLTAVGLAVPSIEAWLLCSRDAHVSEAAWVTALQEGRFPYRRPELKQRAYGTTRPSLEREVEIATREATRLAKDLTSLERLFPRGFGALAADCRGWKS